MTPAPIVAGLAEQPAYYSLYALYADYALNNARHLEREYFARLRDAVRFIQPLTGWTRPDMKSWSLRLFTERQALARFSPEVASAAWRLVRQAVEEIGQPKGWRTSGPATGRTARPAHTRAGAPPRTTQAPRPAEPPFPRSPVDYRMAV
jgi:hypothetical protein